MKLRINGLEREVAADLRLSDLLVTLDLPPGRVAVERNGEIVPRGRFPETALAEGDALEVVQFVGGG